MKPTPFNAFGFFYRQLGVIDKDLANPARTAKSKRQTTRVALFWPDCHWNNLKTGQRQSPGH
jgi:hypothetical protein